MNSTTAPTKPALADRLRNLPPWASVLAIAVVLAGAGYFVWDHFYGPTAVGQEFDVGEIPRRGIPAIMRAPPPAKEGVNLLGAGLWRIKSGDFSMNVPVKTAVADIRLFYDKPDLLPADQIAVLQARRDIVNNPAFAKKINITPDQLKQLQAIPGGQGGGLKLTPPDRDTVKSLWDQYNAVTGDARKAKETELLAALREIGQGALAPTREQYAQRVQQVKAVLTPEQTKALTP